MNKKILICLFSCLLFSCGEEEIITGSQNTHDEKAWFTSEELEKVHLENLPAPVNCQGEINSSTSWFNDGYSFSQPCSSEEIMIENATNYFDYFKNNYDGKFGTKAFHASSSDTYYYYIVQKDNLDNYHDDNPSSLYDFYYVIDTEVGEDGYLKDGAVYSFDIRYEFSTSSNEYLLKIFIEKENKSHNGAINYKFKLQ